MNKIDTGGPAFPTLTDDRYFHGMDLRDYFAAKAMQGMLSSEQIQMAIGKTITPEKVASVCYDWADAMLEARNVTD